LSIPKNYIKEVENAEKNPWYFKMRSRGLGNAYSDLFLIDQMLCIAGINDMCMGIIRAEQVRNGNFDLKGLNQYALDRARAWDTYSSKREEISDKTPRGIADTTWSIFWLMNPITDVNNESILYEKIAIGNYKSWSIAHQRRLIGLRYVDKVRKQWYERWKDSGAIAELSKYRGGWTGGLCYPEQLLIYAAPELHIALMSGNGNTNRDKGKSQYIF
jgi:hypothetical protein